MEPLNMHGHANTFEEELVEVCRERDELRAEVGRAAVYAREQEEGWRRATFETEQLRADLQGLMDESTASREAMDRARKEIDSLRAYNEMLLKVEREHVAEIERLTVAAHRFEEEARQATFEVERLRAALGSTLNYLDSRLYKEAGRTVREALDKP